MKQKSRIAPEYLAKAIRRIKTDCLKQWVQATCLGDEEEPRHIKKDTEEGQSVPDVGNGQELSCLNGTRGLNCNIMVKRGYKNYLWSDHRKPWTPGKDFIICTAGRETR